METNRQLKLIVLGDAQVGKTALLSKYVLDMFRPQYKPTIGADFLTKEILLGDWVLKLQMWDTAGQERFRSLGAAFYRGADCCLLVYDVTSRSSFEAIEWWRDDFLNQIGSVDRGAFPFVLVGNKADKEGERQVGWSEAQTWARNNGDMPLFETSAQQGSHVQAVFEQVAHLALAKT